jgi:tRNA(Ile)-lysidine synthase
MYLCQVQKQFLQFIDRHGLASKGQLVFVAVSGGIDSMVLLHVFANAGFRIKAVHVNFGLRGEESDADEAFVREKCHQWEVPFVCKNVPTKNYATERGISIQMAARDLRYQWFSELLKSEPGSVLATAHHVNDSGETMLLNLIRGTGIDGLTGIPLQNHGVIRPLAFATRADIHNYAAANTIVWREDESNADDHYQRNFLRHRVMGLLKQINPSIDDTLARNSNRMSGERELVERSVADWKESFITQEGEMIRVKKDGLKGFIHKSGVLLRMIEPFGFNFSAAESIVAAMDGQPGKKFLTNTHQLIVDRSELVISSLKSDTNECVINASDEVVECGSEEITIERSANTAISKDLSIASLDADKLAFPLVWRRWKDGDKFQPLGMSGQKKLSDFFVDEKISVADKELVTVIISNNEIVWVVGMRINDKFKIGVNTANVVTLRVKPTKPRS